MQHATSRRSFRLAEQVMRELSLVVAEEVADPRLAGVSITGVRLNADLSVAEALFTLPGGPAGAGEAMQAFAKAKGFLRTKVGARVKMKFVPELRFLYDEFIEEMVYARPAE
ncbi:MAG: 30S ribosome-binding factor RbfA [Desulfovibrionaceae bacterium]|nr:30S ribosome-binding factor RbfA [Desulfovibrionaceae bacterium]MBF0514971.1 30S ribosome-binding factor RbfA [Desulfovibrionaceae bacterium]